MVIKLRIRNFKKRKFKPNKKVIASGFIGFCIALGLWIGFAAPGSYLYASSDTGYDNTNSGMSSDNVQDALDELYQCAEEKNATNITLSVGDVVKMTPTLSSYKTEPKYTGYSMPQTITPTELNLWRVIRVNDDGTYDAVSEYVSSTDVTFQGKTGYQSLVYYLNVLASKYENTKYTVDSRIMGYNGQTLFITDTSYFDGTDLKAGTEWKSSTSGTPAEEYLGRGDSLYTTDYELVKAAYGGTDNSYAKANMVGTSTVTIYWLGSRHYSYSRYGFSFNSRFVDSYGRADYNRFRYYDSGSWFDLSRSYALRPIITLRSGLRGTGSGTASDPYVLK